jgi:hypothetical protein
VKPAVAAGVPVVKKTRGKNKKPRHKYVGPQAVLPLELDASDGAVHRIGQLFSASYSLERALIRDAQAGCRTFWADVDGREKNYRGALGTAGVTAEGLADQAKRHRVASGWLPDHLSAALVLHASARVAETVSRHVFGDKTGKRSGAPKVGRWFDYTTITGRAKSHTKPNVWETFRLVGSLDGHLATYRHQNLPDTVTTAANVLSLEPGVSILAQPASLPTPAKPKGGWWTYDGPLAMVYTMENRPDLVVPVRLPQGSGQWPYLAHYLANPAVWHKIDLVRVQDRKAPGGWRYHAHLTTHQAGYTAPSTRTRRAAVPAGRTAGVDGNVSKLGVVSAPTDPADTGAVRADYVTVTDRQRAAAQKDTLTARRRQRHLDRSRRGANPDQYQLSKRQQKRADSRAAAGLPPVVVDVPKGPRKANKAGIPTRAYRKDELSGGYRATAADHAGASRAASQAKQGRAADVAARLVAVHGAHWWTEHVNMTHWARLWGKSINLFSPGMLLVALTKEAEAAGGSVTRIGTRQTALSQHCLCGTRVPKQLADRNHLCPTCGLTGDRDLVSAAGAICVTLPDPAKPATARRDPQLGAVLLQRLAGQHEVLARSTGTVTTVNEDGGTGNADTPKVSPGTNPEHSHTPDTPACPGRLDPPPDDGDESSGFMPT